METRADDDEAPTDPAARKQMHHDYTEQDFAGTKTLFMTMIRKNYYTSWSTLKSYQLSKS